MARPTRELAMQYGREAALASYHRQGLLRQLVPPTSEPLLHLIIVRAMATAPLRVLGVRVFGDILGKRLVVPISRD